MSTTTSKLKQHEKELKLENYLRSSNKIDMNYIISAWHSKVFSTESKSKYLKENAAVMTRAIELNRGVIFNSKTKYLQIDTTRNIAQRLDEYSTKAESVLPYNWTKNVKVKPFNVVHTEWVERAATLGWNSPVKYIHCDRKNPKIKRQHNFLYGLELELSVCSDAPLGLNAGKRHFNLIYERLLNSLSDPNMAIAKADSSLGSSGLELVLVPLTFYELKKEMKAILQNKDLVNDLFVTEKHGVHIHVTKEAFTERQLAYMLYIFNSPIWDNFLYAITGRDSYHFYAKKDTEYFHKVPDHLPTIIDMMLYSKNSIKGDAGFKSYLSCITGEHQARGVVSVSTRHPTIEFRGFNSTLNPEILTSYLELIASLLEFCSQGSGGVSFVKNNLNPYSYINWLIDKEGKGTQEGLKPRLEYANLIRRIVLDILPYVFTVDPNTGTISRQANFTNAPEKNYVYKIVEDTTICEEEDDYEDDSYEDDSYEEEDDDY